MDAQEPSGFAVDALAGRTEGAEVAMKDSG